MIKKLSHVIKYLTSANCGVLCISLWSTWCWSDSAWWSWRDYEDEPARQALCSHLEARAGGNPVTNWMQTEHRSHLFTFTPTNTRLLWMTSLETGAPTRLVPCTGTDVHLCWQLWGCRSRGYCTLKNCLSYKHFLLYAKCEGSVTYFIHVVVQFLNLVVLPMVTLCGDWSCPWKIPKSIHLYMRTLFSFLWKTLSAASARCTSCPRVTRTFLKAVVDTFFKAFIPCLENTQTRGKQCESIVC